MAKGTTVRMWRRSLVVLIFLVFFCFSALAVKLFILEFVQGEFLQKMASEQQMADTKINAKLTKGLT